MTSLVQKYMQQRVSAEQAGTVDLLLRMLSPFQRKFVTDPARFKIARCGRRAGKTYAIAVYLILECLLNPRTPVLYAGLTRDSAKKAIWDILITVLEALRIPHHARPSTLTVEFDNGSEITLFGCDAQNARNRLRGRKFKLICFDETGFYAAIDPLVTAVLPMLADYGGTLCLTSSPGELLSGFFYEADQGSRSERWSRYHWTMHDNPLFQKKATDPKYVSRAEEELAIICDLEYNGDATNPAFRREYLGLWATSDRSLVYPVGPQNLVDDWKLIKPQYAIGIELGSPAANSIVVGRYSEFSRDFHFVESHVLTDLDMDLDGLAAEIQKRIDQYNPEVVVATTGDFGEGVVAEMRRRYKLPMRAADTTDTQFHQRVFATDLKASHIKINRDLPLVSEFSKIVKDQAGNEIKGQQNWSANAALAVYRTIYQTHLQSFEPPLSDEERHIHQLEQSQFAEELPWYERY